MSSDEQYAETVGKRMTEFPIERRDLLQATGAGLLGTAGVGAAQATDTRETSGGDLIWEFTQPSGEVASSPTVVDSTVYIGSNDGTLYAVDVATGNEEWAFTQPSGAVSSSPTAVDDTIYVGSRDNTLYAVDVSSGSQQWIFTQPSGSVNSSPTIADNTVYVGSDDSNLYAVDADSGSQQWIFTQPSDAIYSSPTVVDNTVYVGSNDSNLYAVDVDSGNQKWVFTQPSGLVQSSPTVADDTVYVGSDDSNLYAVDAATGIIKWSLDLPSSSPIAGSSPTVFDSTVYIGSGFTVDNSALYAVDAESGDQEWAFTQLAGPVTSSPTVAGSTVYVGSIYPGSTLHAVNAATGSQEWAFDTGGDVYSSPTVANGTVYIGSGYSSNALYAVDAGVEGSSEGSRVRLRTLGHHNKNVEQPPDPDPTGTVTGQVTDEAGDSLADATVEFVPTGADTPEQTTTTDDSGAYEAELPADTTYDVTANKTGYVPHTDSVLNLQQNTVRTVDFILCETPDGFDPTVHGFDFENWGGQGEFVPEHNHQTILEEEFKTQFDQEWVPEIQSVMPVPVPEPTFNILADALYDTLRNGPAALHSDGHCYGMCLLAQDYFETGIPDTLPGGVETAAELEKPTGDYSMVGNSIDQLHRSQALDSTTISEWRAFENYDVNVREELQGIQSAIDEQGTALIGIATTPSDNESDQVKHQVLGYDLTVRGNSLSTADTASLEIYDPQAPASDYTDNCRRLEIDLSGSPEEPIVNNNQTGYDYRYTRFLLIGPSRPDFLGSLVFSLATIGDFFTKFIGGFVGFAASGAVTLTATDPEGEPLSSVADDVLAGTDFDVMQFQQGSDVSVGNYQVEVTTADENGTGTATTDDGPVEYTLRGVGSAAAGTTLDEERTQEIEPGETQQFTVTMPATPPLPGYDSAPQDLDGDGLYEDVRGTGDPTVLDVQTLFNNLDSTAVQNNAAGFDFSDTGGDVTVLDVQALFQKLS